MKQIIERASQDGKDFEHECRLVMPDNAIKHIYVVAYAVTNESNKLEFVGAVMDVTARRQAEGALRYQNGTEPVSRQRHIRIDPKD